MKLLTQFKEPLLALLTLVALLVLLSTRDVSMPGSVNVMLLGFFALGVIGLGVFVWQENPADEREAALSMQAGKHAYLIGSIVMGLGIIVQSLDHRLDVWLPLGLGSMVLVKLTSFFIHRKQQE